MRRYLLKALIILSLILMAFSSCDENVYMGEYIHYHYYYVQSDGAWQCNCGHVLEGTEKPYITYIKNSQPTEIIDLTVDPPLEEAVGLGVFTLNEAGTEMAYTNSGTAGQEVYIRTDSTGTSLTINASPDIVYHYGTIGLLDIVAVKSSSYHERGRALFAEIANGRLVLDKGSDVSRLHLKKSVEDTTEIFDNITLSKAPGIELPEITRDYIKVGESGTLVLAVQNDTAIETEKEYFWLTAVGVYEQIALSDNDTSPKKKSTNETVYVAEASDSTEQSTERVMTAHYIANTYTSGSGEEEVRVSAELVTDEQGEVSWNYVVTNAITGIKNDDYTASKDTEKNTIVIDKPGSSETIETVITNGTSVDEIETEKSKAMSDAAKIEQAIEEGFEVIHVEGKAATCEDSGYSAYDYYMNGELEVRIGYKEIPALGHYFVSRWDYNTDQHWHECSHSCGTKSDIATHTLSYTSDSSKHWEECSVCGYTTEPENHDYSGQWYSDQTGHWHVCPVCNTHEEVTEHTVPDTWTYNSTTQMDEKRCPVCDYLIEEQSHQHRYGEWETISESTCTTHGSRKRTCECGHEEVEELPLKPHSYSDDWSSDGTSHWHECTVCGARSDESAHSYIWTYDDDQHWQYCSVCNYQTTHEDHDLTILFTPGTLPNTVKAITECETENCAYTHTSDDFPSTTGAFFLTQSYNGVTAQRKDGSTWTVSVSDEIKTAYASCKWFNSTCSEQLPNTSTNFDPIEVTIEVDGTTEWVRVYCLYYDSGNNLAGGGYVDICK